MKKEFDDLKTDINKQEKKQIAKMKTEINGLKEDYSKFMEDMKKETHARNEAETLVKVLKDTLEAKAKLEESKPMKVKDDKKKQNDARNEAEGMAKVNKDDLEAKDSLDKVEGVEDMDIEERGDDSESDGGEWKEQRKIKKKMKKRLRNRSESEQEKDIFNCESCGEKFEYIFFLF